MTGTALLEEDLDDFPECPGEGELGAPPPSYVSTDGETWSCATPDGGSGLSDGFGAAFALVLVLGLVLGGVGLAVKVHLARRMATRSGMDPNEATLMSVFTDDGFEATYLASNLRQQPTPETPTPETPTREPGPAPQVPAADRLRRLDDLRAEGLLSEVEYAERRAAILDEL